MFSHLICPLYQIRDYAEQGDSTNYYIRLFNNQSNEDRMQNLPTCVKVTTLITWDNNTIERGRRSRPTFVQALQKRQFVNLSSKTARGLARKCASDSVFWPT